MGKNNDLIRRIKQLEMLSNTVAGGFYVGDYDLDKKKYRLTNATTGKPIHYTKTSLIGWLNQMIEQGESFTIWFGVMHFEVFELGHPLLIKSTPSGGLEIDNKKAEVIRW